MTLLITGGSGVLGRALGDLIPDALRPPRIDLDVTDERSVRTYLNAHPPSAVVHAAALTDLPRCEADHELATLVNVQGTDLVLTMAREAAPQCFFLYVSTAGVFRGDRGNYDEEAQPDPMNYYGRTKLAGEKLVEGRPDTCVVRTNFVRRGPWPHPRAFTDRFGTFLYDTGAARGIRDLLAARKTGIVHVCGDRRLSLFDLARRSDPNVQPTTLEAYHGIPLMRDMSLITKRWHPYTLDD